MLKVSRLLIMANDIKGFHFIIVGEMFFDLLVVALFYNFGGYFKSSYFPINLEFHPLEVARPSFMAFEPSSTYTLIRS